MNDEHDRFAYINTSKLKLLDDRPGDTAPTQANTDTHTNITQ